MQPGPVPPAACLLRLVTDREARHREIMTEVGESRVTCCFKVPPNPELTLHRSPKGSGTDLLLCSMHCDLSKAVWERSRNCHFALGKETCFLYCYLYCCCCCCCYYYYYLPCFF